MTRNQQNELTRGEEEVMRIIWQTGSCTVNDIIARMRDPKPKYTTVATFVKILENKGFVGHEAAGKGFRYHPLVDRSEYAGRAAAGLLADYFNGSLSQMVSFFSQRENISVGEMNEIMEILERLNERK